MLGPFDRVIHMRVRIFQEIDSKQALRLVSVIIINEFHFSLQLEESGLDSHLLHIEEHYNKSGYSQMVLDTSKWLVAAKSLYLKNGFVDTERFNNNYRADGKSNCKAKTLFLRRNS